MWAEATPARSHADPEGLWDLPKHRGLISPGPSVAAGLFLFDWVGFAAVAVGRRYLTRSAQEQRAISHRPYHWELGAGA
jgi:hypothetical protein